MTQKSGPPTRTKDTMAHDGWSSANFQGLGRDKAGSTDSKQPPATPSKENGGSAATSKSEPVK